MRGKLKETFIDELNCFHYLKGEVVTIYKVCDIPKSHCIYRETTEGNTIDWIPMELIEIF